jgi:hypothetical protein
MGQPHFGIVGSRTKIKFFGGAGRSARATRFQQMILFRKIRISLHFINLFRMTFAVRGSH